MGYFYISYLFFHISLTLFFSLFSPTLLMKLSINLKRWQVWVWPKTNTFLQHCIFFFIFGWAFGKILTILDVSIVLVLSWQENKPDKAFLLKMVQYKPLDRNNSLVSIPFVWSNCSVKQVLLNMWRVNEYVKKYSLYMSIHAH